MSFMRTPRPEHVALGGDCGVTRRGRLRLTAGWMNSRESSVTPAWTGPLGHLECTAIAEGLIQRFLKQKRPSEHDVLTTYWHWIFCCSWCVHNKSVKSSLDWPVTNWRWRLLFCSDNTLTASRVNVLIQVGIAVLVSGFCIRTPKSLAITAPSGATTLEFIVL